MKNLVEGFEEEIVKPAKKKVELFLGRTNPPHKGHQAIIKMMKNPVFALVKGKETSKDKDRNPFDEKYQTKLLKKMFSSLKIIVVPNGYVPEIMNELRKQGMEVTAVYAGDDRINAYKKQIDMINEKLEDRDLRFKIKMKQTPRVTSATTVRTALKDNDEKIFKANMPKELHGEFKTMRKKMGLKT